MDWDDFASSLGNGSRFIGNQCIAEDGTITKLRSFIVEDGKVIWLSDREVEAELILLNSELKHRARSKKWIS